MKFIDLKYKIIFDVLTLAHVLEVKQEIFWEILEKIKPLKLFNEYLQYGYYPFFIESGMNYSNRLMNTINIVLESDMPAIYHIDFYSILKMKKMLAVLSHLTPYKPNIQKLAAQSGTSRDSLLKSADQKKSRKQIAGIEDAYVVSDSIEYRIGNKIPLWLFGFLY